MSAMEDEDEGTSLLALPLEVLASIAHFLTPPHRRRFRLVCHKFR